MAKIKNKKKVQQSKELSSAEDFLNEGTELEESGDRFTLSDLSKSLRFYQQGYDYYNKAAATSEGNKQVLFDALYNSCRLLFHVYDMFVKDGIVNFDADLSNVDIVANSDDSILKPLTSILSNHEQTIAMFEDHPNYPWDLVFNTCLVYTEVIENCNDSSTDTFVFETYVSRSLTLFEQCLQYQISELKKLIDEENGVNNDAASSNDENLTGDDDYTAQEAIVPSTVLETIKCAYLLILSIIESGNLNAAFNSVLQDKFSLKISLFQEWLNRVSEELIRDFASDHKYFFEKLLNDELVRLFHIQQSIEGLKLNSVDEILSHWQANGEKIEQTGLELTNVPERFTMIADNLQSFYDKQNDQFSSVEDHWNLLTSMTLYYKKSQEQYRDLFKARQGSKNANDLVELSPIITQLVSILISRTDIDVTRLKHEQFATYEKRAGIENVITQNIENFLKSALIYLNVNCGFREKIFDKLNKRQKYFQVLARQYVLGISTNISVKPAEADMVRKEVQNVKELEIYKKI